MAIQSVTSSISAYTNPSAQTTQAQQSAKPDQVEKREPRPEDRVELKEEKPRPVVNAQGQMTGKLIDVTA